MAGESPDREADCDFRVVTPLDHPEQVLVS
jgi:hypothetical protein